MAHIKQPENNGTIQNILDSALASLKIISNGTCEYSKPTHRYSYSDSENCYHSLNIAN